MFEGMDDHSRLQFLNPVLKIYKVIKVILEDNTEEASGPKSWISLFKLIIIACRGSENLILQHSAAIFFVSN